MIIIRYKDINIRIVNKDILKLLWNIIIIFFTKYYYQMNDN